MMIWPIALAFTTSLPFSDDAAPSLTRARDRGHWTDRPEVVSEWYRSLMQPDNPWVFCCGEADAYWADTFEVEGDHYVAVITDGRTLPFRPMIPPGTRVPVPNAKMKIDAGNPTGHGVLFIEPGGRVFCYVAPGGV
jgi:hypothetical protein